MTIIIARGGVMAADTGTFSGSIVIDFDAKKVVRLSSGHLVGCCGGVAEVELFKRWAEQGFSPGQEPFKVKEDEFGAVVMAPDGSLSKYDSECHGYPAVGGWAADGSHLDFVAALMLTGMSAVDAVAMCIKHGSYAAGSVYSLTLAGEEAIDEAQEAAGLLTDTEPHIEPDSVFGDLPDQPSVQGWREARGLV